MAVVDVRDLHKFYGDVHAVNGLSFRIDAGEVYALLGENGAGKSTAVEILEGHRIATSGAVEVRASSWPAAVDGTPWASTWPRQLFALPNRMD